MKRVIVLKVVGVWFYNFKVTQGMHYKNDTVDIGFEPEPTNKYDKEAIKVLLDGKQIGYIENNDDKKILWQYIHDENAEICKIGLIEHTRDAWAVNLELWARIELNINEDV